MFTFPLHIVKNSLNKGFRHLLVANPETRQKKSFRNSGQTQFSYLVPVIYPLPPQKNHMSYLDNFILMYTRNILKYFVLKYVLLRQYNCWNMQASVKNL